MNTPNTHGCNDSDTLTYTAAHKRVYRTRGKATTYQCVDCGRPARDWSYDGTDPNEIVEHIGGFVDRPVRRFSLDVARYSPRCRKCHATRDLGGPRKPHCLRGHEIAAHGRDALGRCRQCQRDDDRRRRQRRRDRTNGCTS